LPSITGRKPSILKITSKVLPAVPLPKKDSEILEPKNNYLEANYRNERPLNWRALGWRDLDIN
jgi:hypothetical protein